MIISVLNISPSPKIFHPKTRRKGISEYLDYITEASSALHTGEAASREEVRATDFLLEAHDTKDGR